MSDWDTTFRGLFPDAYNNKDGHWWWQELNILYDIHTGSRIPMRINELAFWQGERQRWVKRNDKHGLATQARIERIIVMLVQYKMKEAG